MSRNALKLAREVASGQLLLFARPVSSLPAVQEPALPDLIALFEELNRRFFKAELEARVEWSERLTACAGTCTTPRGLIRISLLYHRRMPDALTMTMAHEMCHLVVPGHGPAYRALARPIAAALGATWREFRYSERWADLKRYRYVYACPACGRELPSKKRRRASCGQCSSGHYDERYHLVLTESRARPGPVLLGQRPVRCP